MRVPWVMLMAFGFMCLCSWSLSRWRNGQIALPACEMTYNYNGYEQQTSLLLPNTTGYTLHLYRDAVIQYGPKGPPNQPILFIPGNAGRHMQARSLASESGRQWARSDAKGTATSPNHTPEVNLDWYTVDTLEQLSAFHGDVLDRQVDFVVACLRYLKLAYGLQPGQYPGLILMGHSMGGVVARAAAARAALDPELGPGLVSLLLTLSSPHQHPPLPSHPSLHRFYAQLAAVPSPDVPLLSLAGGYNDTQVAAALTQLQGIAGPSLSLHTSLEDIPGVWASADHNCIVWCNQLAVKLAAMLLAVAREGRSGGEQEQQQQRGGGSSVPGQGWRTRVQRRNEMVMRHARATLVGTTVQTQLLLPPLTRPKPAGGSAAGGGAGGGAQGSRSRPGAAAKGAGLSLGGALQRAQGSECRGANLVWYMQYGQPKVMTKKLTQLKHSSIKGQAKTGGLYLWKLNATSTQGGQPSSAGAEAGQTLGFSLTVSAAKPCTGFRVWVLRDGAAASSSEAEAARDEALGRDVEVTALAVRLPPLHPAARQVVRNWGDSQMVMQGKDYDAASAWAMRLPAQLLQDASGIVIWIGEVSIKKAFQLNAQLYMDTDPIRPEPLITLLRPHLESASPVHRLPPVARLRLQAPSLLPWQALGLRVVQEDAGQWQHRGDGKPAAKKCLHPLLVVQLDEQSGTEHVVANLTTFNLAACGEQAVHGGGGVSSGGGICSVTLLLDRGCSYRLRLVPDPAPLLPGALLQRLHMLWALLQAALLFALARPAPGGAQRAAATGDTAPPATAAAIADSGTDVPAVPAERAVNGKQQRPASTGPEALTGEAVAPSKVPRAPASLVLDSAFARAVLHGLGWSGVYLAVSMLAAAVPMLAAQSGSNGGSRAALVGGAWEQLQLAIGTVDGWVAEVVGQLAALALVAPIACLAGGSLSGAWEHALATALVAAAAATEAATRLFPSAGTGLQVQQLTADVLLLLLLPAAASALVLVHTVLFMVAFLLRQNWKVVSYPMSAVLSWVAKGGGGRGQQESSDSGGSAGSGRQGAGAPAPGDGMTAGAVAAILFAAAVALLHEQIVAWLCCLGLAVAAHPLSRGGSSRGPGVEVQVTQAKLWAVFFAIRAVIATPSLVSIAQLQHSAASDGQGISWRALLKGLRRSAYASSSSDSWVNVGDSLACLVPAAACLVMAWRLALGASPRRTGSSEGHLHGDSLTYAVILRAAAKAGLVCAALGWDWVPHYVQLAVACVQLGSIGMSW